MTSISRLIRSLDWQGAARLTDMQTAHTFENLYREGLTAYRAGELKRAHELWRDAATVDPYQEKLWIALLHVLETEEDRRVCLENILAINPGSAKARRDLAALERTAARTHPQRRPLPMWARFLLAFARGLLIGTLAASIGVGVSIILYGLVR